MFDGCYCALVSTCTRFLLSSLVSLARSSSMSSQTQRIGQPNGAEKSRAETIKKWRFSPTPVLSAITARRDQRVADMHNALISCLLALRVRTPAGSTRLRRDALFESRSSARQIFCVVASAAVRPFIEQHAFSGSILFLQPWWQI